MPFDKEEESFYICLQSNDSMKNFPENTLSAFTNLLKKPHKFGQKWLVGLTEFGYGAFSEKSAPLMRNPNRESSGDESVELLVPVKRKRKIKRNASISEDDKLSIEINGTIYNISVHELEKISYKSTKIDINFNRLLKLLHKKITSEDDLKFAKEQMLNALNIINSVDTKKISNKKPYFTIHIYQGSTESNNINLNVNNQTVAIFQFFAEIISQIPKTKRNIGSLKYTLNSNFYPKYDAKKMPINPEKKHTAGKIEVGFKEFGVDLSANLSDVKKQTDGSINFDDLIDEFVSNLDKTNVSNALKIKEHIKNAMIDYLKDTDNFVYKTDKQASFEEVKLNVPISATANIQTVLKIKNFEKVEDFLGNIYSQIKPEARDKKVFADTLSRIVQNDEPKVIVPKELANLLPENASDAVLKNNNNNKDDSNVGLNIWRDPIFQHTVQENLRKQEKSTPTNLNRITQHVAATTGLMFVYTDIINPRCIGSIESRFLRVVPCADSKGGCISFKNVEYCPLEKTFIESISILIADGTGKKIAFNSSTKPTYIMLHFKK